MKTLDDYSDILDCIAECHAGLSVDTPAIVVEETAKIAEDKDILEMISGYSPDDFLDDFEMDLTDMANAAIDKWFPALRSHESTADSRAVLEDGGDYRVILVIPSSGYEGVYLLGLYPDGPRVTTSWGVRYVAEVLLGR